MPAASRDLASAVPASWRRGRSSANRGVLPREGGVTVLGRAHTVALVVDFGKLQWAAYAVMGVLVLALGATYLEAGKRHGPGAAGRRSPAPVRVRPAGAAGVVVDVAGAVRRPGVYRLRAEGRVQDAVERAGGPAPGAQLSAINLAARLTDGAQILVPARVAAGAGAVGTGAPGSPVPVNLNTATPEQLDGLDGIGPTTARKIVEYRQAHGGFGSLQDLDRIPGIGPKRMAALRGKVTV